MPTLNIQAFNQHAAYNSGIANVLRFVAIDFYQQPNVQYAFVYGATDPTSLPYPTYLDDDTAIAAMSATAGASLLSTVNTSIGTSYYTTYDVEQIAPPVGAYLFEHYVPNTTTVNGHTLTGNIVVGYGDLTGQPGLAAVATSGSYTDLSNKPTIPTIPTRSFTSPTRPLNTAFQISTTQDAIVSYSVDISASLSLLAGATGTVYLRYADDSAHTTNVVEVCRTANGNTGTLTLGLGLTQTNTGTISGVIPTGKYAKLVTENTTGTPTFIYRKAQEVLI